MKLKKPDPKIIAGCALSIRRYIERLEAHIQQLEESNQSDVWKDSVCDHLGVNSLKAMAEEVHRLKSVEAEHKTLQELHLVALDNLSKHVSQARQDAGCLSDQHEAAVIQWETTMMRLVGEDGIADVEKAISKLKAQAQQATLDQLAASVLPVATEVLQKNKDLLSRLVGVEDGGILTGGKYSQALAASAYLMADAMREESKKWQGDAA